MENSILFERASQSSSHSAGGTLLRTLRSDETKRYSAVGKEARSPATRDSTERRADGLGGTLLPASASGSRNFLAFAAYLAIWAALWAVMIFGAASPARGLEAGAAPSGGPRAAELLRSPSNASGGADGA